MSVKDVLVSVREKIVQGWTQGTFARDASGARCSDRAFSAVCWCIRGAIYASTLDGYLIGAAHDALQKGIGGEGLTVWNDAPERKKEEVLELIDKVISEG